MSEIKEELNEATNLIRVMKRHEKFDKSGLDNLMVHLANIEQLLDVERQNPSELKKALQDALKQNISYINNPNYSSSIEQNAAETVVRILGELDEVADYERILLLESTGKKSTELIAHLKDQHGFNEVEEGMQDEINKVFRYEDDW